MDAKPSKSASTLVEGREVYIPLEGLIDLDSERDRVKKEIGKLEGLITGQQKKLANEKFVANAPEELVANEREKLTTYEADKAKLTAHLADLG